MCVNYDIIMLIYEDYNSMYMTWVSNTNLNKNLLPPLPAKHCFDQMYNVSKLFVPEFEGGACTQGAHSVFCQVNTYNLAFFPNCRSFKQMEAMQVHV